MYNKVCLYPVFSHAAERGNWLRLGLCLSACTACFLGADKLERNRHEAGGEDGEWKQNYLEVNKSLR
jgi:hypothetical protein